MVWFNEIRKALYGLSEDLINKVIESSDVKTKLIENPKEDIILVEVVKKKGLLKRTEKRLTRYRVLEGAIRIVDTTIRWDWHKLYLVKVQPTVTPCVILCWGERTNRIIVWR